MYTHLWSPQSGTIKFLIMLEGWHLVHKLSIIYQGDYHIKDGPILQDRKKFQKVFLANL